MSLEAWVGSFEFKNVNKVVSDLSVIYSLMPTWNELANVQTINKEKIYFFKILEWSKLKGGGGGHTLGV